MTQGYTSFKEDEYMSHLVIIVLLIIIISMLDKGGNNYD